MSSPEGAQRAEQVESASHTGLAHHPCFIAPSNPDIPLWRYMNFPKFVAMLADSSLYFASLSSMQDPYEGTYPHSNALRWRHELRNAMERGDRGAASVIEHNSAHFQWSQDAARISIAINCWYMAEHESAAMWKLYSPDPLAVCVRTTFRALREVLPAFVRIGAVKYIDFRADEIPEQNFLHLATHKRREFSHERELRAAVWFLDSVCDHLEPDARGGIAVPVDLHSLLTGVYVAPGAPEWFRGLVGRTGRQFGYEFEALKSDLDYPSLLELWNQDRAATEQP